jgi:hypothetical protein
MHLGDDSVRLLCAQDVLDTGFLADVLEVEPGLEHFQVIKYHG